MTNYYEHHKLMTMILPALLLALFWLVFLFLSLDRARSLPMCWGCGAMKVRRARSRGILDTFAALSLLSPFRCRGCLRRFYALRIPRRSLERAVP